MPCRPLSATHLELIGPRPVMRVSFAGLIGGAPSQNVQTISEHESSRLDPCRAIGHLDDLLAKKSGPLTATAQSRIPANICKSRSRATAQRLATTSATTDTN